MIIGTVAIEIEIKGDMGEVYHTAIESDLVISIKGQERRVRKRAKSDGSLVVKIAVTLNLCFRRCSD